MPLWRRLSRRSPSASTVASREPAPADGVPLLRLVRRLPALSAAVAPARAGGSAGPAGFVRGVGNGGGRDMNLYGENTASLATEGSCFMCKHWHIIENHDYHTKDANGLLSGHPDDIIGECRRYPPKANSVILLCEFLDRLAREYEEYEMHKLESILEVLSYDKNLESYDAAISSSQHARAYVFPAVTGGMTCGEWCQRK